MPTELPLTLAQHVVQVCLLVFAGIGLMGGTLQLVLGQPETTPRLDNVHRFMAGIYLGTGLICLWAGFTVREQGMLIDLLAVGVCIGGLGRVVSMVKVGLPEPRGVWLGYLVPELLLPVVMLVARHWG